MNLKDAFVSLDNYFSPKIIGEVNDQYIKESAREYPKALETIFETRIGTLTDSILKVLTLKKWKSKFRYMNEDDFKIALKTTKNISKHHPSNFQKKVILSLNTKLEEVQSKYNVVLQRENV